MPKRNRRLPLLALLCLALALVCVAALLIWLNIGSSGDEEKTQKSGEGRSSKSRAEEDSSADTANETSGSANANTATSTPFGTPSMESEAQEQTLLSDEEAFSSGPSPLSESGQSQHVPVCAHPSPELLAETPNCQETPAISAPVGPWLEGQQPQDLIRAFEYGLNISVQPLGQSLHAQLSMLAELSEESAVLALHCGRELGAISESEVRVWHCQSGSFVCVRSLTRLLDRQLLLVELAQPMVAGALLRLQFLHLRVPLLASAALLVQIPSPWEKDRAWLLASQFPQAGGVRALFPAVDWPQGRAVFRLCLTHAADTTARANTRAAAPGRELPGTGQVETCFKETPSLPPAQLAFALFRNLRPVPSANQNTKTELFIGSHLQPEDYGWALEETEATMRRMAELAGVQYPVDMLTLISSPLMATNDAVGGLGLVQIRDSWIEYPKFVHTHSLVVGQVVRQWTANLLSLCDQCLQGGISLFLEWLLASEFGPVEDKAAEFRRRVGEARQRLMGSEHRANPMECAERAAFVLQMLDRTFGRPTSSQFLNLLFRRHSWDAKCTSTATLSRLYLEASQKPQAQRVFDSFLPSSSSNSSTAAISNSSSSIPLLQVRVQPQSSLLFLAQMGTDSGQPLPWIPVEFVDDTGRSTQLMLNSSELAVPLVISSFLIAQPSSFARFVYNVENYMRLADCLGRAQTGGCPSVDIITLKEAINDLCWALVHRKLIVKTEAEVPQWRQLFQSLAGRVAVHGDCACCMMPESEALQGHCRWTWLDKCTRIEAPGLH